MFRLMCRDLVRQKVTKETLPPKIPYLIYNKNIYIAKKKYIVLHGKLYFFRLMMALHMSRSV